jgi:hypothetical protein
MWCVVGKEARKIGWEREKRRELQYLRGQKRRIKKRIRTETKYL